MKIAILEPDVDALDRALEALSAAGHLCFGTTSDDGVRRMLDDVSVDLFLVDWTEPDGARYETLSYLTQHAPGVPIVLCIAPDTPDFVIDSGMKRGASLVLEKPLRGVDSLNQLHTLNGSGGFLPGLPASTRVM